MNLKKITALMIGAVMAVSMAAPAMADDKVETVTDGKQIGRASCRERV